MVEAHSGLPIAANRESMISSARDSSVGEFIGNDEQSFVYQNIRGDCLNASTIGIIAHVLFEVLPLDDRLFKKITAS